MRGVGCVTTQPQRFGCNWSSMRVLCGGHASNISREFQLRLQTKDRTNSVCFSLFSETSPLRATTLANMSINTMSMTDESTKCLQNTWPFDELCELMVSVEDSHFRYRRDCFPPFLFGQGLSLFDEQPPLKCGKHLKRESDLLKWRWRCIRCISTVERQTEANCC